MASLLFLPEISGLFLSGWNLRASSMYLLLTCVSDTNSFRENPKMPSESLRFTPTPSGLYSLLFRGGGREVNLFGYLVVVGCLSEGVVFLVVNWRRSMIGRFFLNEEIVSYFQSSTTIFFCSTHPCTRILGNPVGPCES